MKKTVFALSALAAAWAGRAALAAGPLTPEQTLERRAVGDLDFSPDGSRLVFTVTERVAGNARARALWLLDVAGGELRQLTFSGKSDSSPRWAPDGQSIAFVSDRDGAARLYRLSMRGGEAEKLSDLTFPQQSGTAFRWSPDGARIALLIPEAKSDAQQKRERDKDDSHVVDKDNRRARVWMLDVTSRQVTQVTSGAWQIRQIEWLPSGDRLIASADAQPASDQWHERLYTIDAKSGAFTEIAAARGPLGAFTVSPDGATVAYIGARVDGPEPHDLVLQPVAGGAPRNVTSATIDRPVSQPRWIDNETVAVQVARGFNTTIALVSRTSQPQFVDGLTVNPSSFARNRAGTIAYAGETATHAPELWIKTPSAAAKVMSHFNQQWASIPIVAPEMVRYKSPDGVEIEAVLLRPAGVARPFQGRERGAESPALPFVVLVHGGPTGRWSDVFEPWGQLLAARGYAVLYPNVRGSVGYGHRFVEMNRADWGGGDFKDVMAGVDWAIAQHIADPDRLGIGGWSYGGYMAAWAVTQTTRFKAAVSGAPVIDMASEFGTEGGSAYDEWFYGTPYEKLDGFVKSSPITFVKNAKTPTLLLQGEDDTTDPIGQSQQFYRGLKRYGVESDFVLYPREPHGLREEKHLLDRLTRIVAWYDKYLKSAATSTAPQP